MKMIVPQQPQYVCVLYLATAGLQGPAMGSDEEEIVLLIYVVIDVPQNKVRNGTEQGGYYLF